MLVSYPNNIKVYNLSAGKSLPEWLSDRKKRKLQQNNDDLRKRVELIQDFDMPDVSGCVELSPNGQFIFVSGTYKPRMRCYDVNDLSLKFERCCDSEIIKMCCLSDGYEKMVFLQEDRWLEFHAQTGVYYKTRVPKFGRDLAYMPSSCDVLVVGASPNIYRLNLELGRFMQPWLCQNCTSINACAVNEVHQLFVAGTADGYVHAFDPRTNSSVGRLDCALNCVTSDTEVTGMPAVSCLKFNGHLQLGVGTTTGQIMMFDIRSNKPLLVKDHYYGLPIRCIDYSPAQDLVLSLDSKVLKMWHRESGKAYTSIEPGLDLNDLALVPDSGLLFMANEAAKNLTYFIPSLGPAPRWCSFLDNITEELEENAETNVYEDYKFLTVVELGDLGLSHLVGTNVLRAYLHGYFIDMRLYHKAKQLANPFAFEEYRKQKIKAKVAEERMSRVQVKKHPKVNRALAERLSVLNDDAAGAAEKLSLRQAKKQKAAKKIPNLLKDNRFASLFTNPDMHVDPGSVEYKLLNPALLKLDKARRARAEKVKKPEMDNHDVSDQELEGRVSSDEGGSDSSSDDDAEYKKAVKSAHREVLQDQKLKRSRERLAKKSGAIVPPKMLELRPGEEFAGWSSEMKRGGSIASDVKKLTLADRIATNASNELSNDKLIEKSVADREISFVPTTEKVKNVDFEMKNAEHLKERKSIRRSAHRLSVKKPGFRRK